MSDLLDAINSTIIPLLRMRSGQRSLLLHFGLMVAERKKKGKMKLQMAVVKPMIYFVTAILPSSACADCFIIDIPVAEIRIFERELNRTRGDLGVGMLTQNNALTMAAARYACEMAETGHFDHVARDGSLPWDRAARAGYYYCYIGENIAAGINTLSSADAGWRNSPGHYRNYVHPAAQDYGIATATTTATASSSRAPSGSWSGLAGSYGGTVVGNGFSDAGPQYWVMLVGSTEC